MPRVHTLHPKAKKAPGLEPLQSRKVQWQSQSMGGHRPAGYAKSSVGFISQVVDAGARFEHFGKSSK
jgi:hypothetical protein